MENRPKLYATLAFVAGVLVCLGYKDIYPDLERRFRRRFGARKTLLNQEWPQDSHIDLEDHESDTGNGLLSSSVINGLQGSIGNTPLIRIKSLSDATGCNIFGKAEVTDQPFCLCCFFLTLSLVPQWLWRQSER